MFCIVIVGSKDFSNVTFKVTTVLKRLLQQIGSLAKGRIHNVETTCKVLSRYTRIKTNSKPEIICRKILGQLTYC